MAMNPSGLTDAQIKQLTKLLSDKLTAVSNEVHDLETSLTQGENDDKGAPDEIDRSSFEEEMQRTQLVLDGKKQLQYEVMEALKRMKEGTFGVCEETEEPIGVKRLTAQPWTRLSLEAQQDLEQRRRNRSGAPGSLYTSAFDGDGSSDES